jgi:hypothetical protein
VWVPRLTTDTVCPLAPGDPRKHLDGLAAFDVEYEVKMESHGKVVNMKVFTPSDQYYFSLIRYH